MEESLMRTLTVALVLTITALSPAMAEEPAARIIDLNAPGAMQRLEQSNPQHHEKVSRILAGVLRQADRDVPRWLQASFAASDVSYAPVLLTSAPPQRRLSFALDGTRYLAVLTLSHVKGEIVPAR
jgi:hypothetical protein